MLAALLGFVLGFIFGGGMVAGDFFRRLVWSWRGGGGESADWGEPLFYWLVLGVPLGIGLGLGAFAITVLVQWMVGRSQR
jgi:hypothetical protein